MKNITFRVAVLLTFFMLLLSGLHAQMKKAGQSGMTYLAISLSARESAMGNASVAAVRGVQALFYNPALLTKFEGIGAAVNQVNWLADTKIYSAGVVYSLARYGTLGLDLVYMDYGKIVGTERVDKSIDQRGYRITGDLNIQDYAIGLAYAYAVNERFSFGTKIKIVHEDLGNAPIAVKAIDESQGLYEYEDRSWKLTDWGFDFGGYYEVGFKNLAFAVAFQNYSGDMQYWSEAFQMPLTIRMGLAMNLAEILMPDNDQIAINTAIDALHPIDYTERVHIGTEFVYRNMLALRAGYKFNYDVENFSLGAGFNFEIEGYAASIDYAYTNAEFFGHVDRFSLNFSF